MSATAARARLAGKVAVAKGGDIKPLGHIIWFSVPDEGVSLNRLKKRWGLAGLELGVLPKDPKAVDAFKRAVREQEGRKVHGDRTVETDVRDVLENAEDVIYQVSRVVRDAQERLVEYPKALRVWYSKVTADIQGKKLGDTPTREALDMLNEIQEAFEKNGKQITGAKVRSLVRSYIKEDTDEQAGTIGLSGENLRGKAGGVYFVLDKFTPDLEKLAEFLEELYTPKGRAYMHMVPLADGASERELIRRHHVTNCMDEMQEAIGEVRELLREDRERGVRSNVAAHHWSKLQRFRRRAAAYNEALHEEQEELNTHLELLNRQLRKLTGV